MGTRMYEILVERMGRAASGLLFLTLMIICACKNNEQVAVVPDTAYYPLHVGLFRIYQVNETTYSEVNGEVSNSYQLKVAVKDSFPDTNGNYTYVLQRSRRDSDGATWTDEEVWSARFEANRFVMNEENTAYVKLTFPATPGETWNGNVYNSLGEKTYRIDSKGGTYQSFHDCLTVTESDDDNLVFTDQRSAVYALGIGLVHLSVKQLNYCTDQDCLGNKTITDGTEMDQTLLDYGG